MIYYTILGVGGSADSGVLQYCVCRGEWKQKCSKCCL